MEKINIELKSEALNEVLSAPPSWLVRSGNMLFLMVILLLLGISFLITYPDEISGDVEIFNSRPPVEFENQLYGKLANLPIKDGQKITKGTIIAQFDNEVNTTDLEQIKSVLQYVLKMDQNASIVIPLNANSINIGSLQQNWISLFGQIKEWNTLQNSNLFEKKIAAIQSEIQQRKKLGSIAVQKIQAIEKELRIQKNQTLATERLYAKSISSKEEVIQAEKTENQLFQNLQNQKERNIENQIIIETLHKNITELQFEHQKQKQQLYSAIQTNASSLRNQLFNWEKNTAWVAPFDGKILFNRHLNKNHYYKTGEASIVLVPNGTRYNAILKIPLSGAGKIKPKQSVFIELTDYAKNEYGMIEGKVKSITSIAKNDFYEVNVDLPKKLITTYHKVIPAKASLKGKAKIITTNKKLIERFFENFTINK